MKLVLKSTSLFAGGMLMLSAGIGQASTTYGTLSNFDVFNDSSTNHYYGFEIELEGIDSSMIPSYNGSYYTFPNWHYGSGQVSTDPLGKVIVRYYDGGKSSTMPYTTPITDTSGHSCIQINGCEHFGLAINGSPTASRYFWLDQTGNRSTQVNLMGAPIITVNPPDPNNGQAVAQAQFVLEAPEGPENPDKDQKFADAVWVKVMKTELDLEHMADLDDLMADNREKIADDTDINGVEVEWKLLQRRLDKPDDIQNKLDSNKQDVGENAEQVLRTYQFFAFTGDYNEEHEATCLDVGTCEDDLKDPANVDRFVGRLLGQQMVAANLNGPIPFPAQVPVPGAVWMFGSTLVAWTLGRRNTRS